MFTAVIHITHWHKQLAIIENNGHCIECGVYGACAPYLAFRIFFDITCWLMYKFIIDENKFVNALVLSAWYAVSLGARVHTHINMPNQSACGPTTTAVRRVDVHQCQGHEIALTQHDCEYAFKNYSLIAFKERVTFWLQRIRPLPCACAYVALFACRLAYNYYAIAHAYSAANAHAQGSDRARWSHKVTLSSKAIGV